MKMEKIYLKMYKNAQNVQKYKNAFGDVFREEIITFVRHLHIRPSSLSCFPTERPSALVH